MQGLRCTVDRGAALGQGWQRIVITVDQCLLLFATPTFDLPFRGYSIFNALESFVDDQRHRSPQRCVTIKGACVMLVDPPF
jgi:hypothetical protein